VAYFIKGRDISKKKTLIDVVAEAGLERQLAERMLHSNEGMDEFKRAEELSRKHSVGGVPFFIINNEITLSGAQQPDVLLAAFRQTSGLQ
jgi:predicted DsbA family dithiol-disulfide isomerase